ncbi:MAG TPA: hypothetical protein VIW93_11030 [Candidatus Acidoferrum sp.]
MPNSPSPVFLAENRSWSYWFADGLLQLLIGISAMLFGFYFISMATPASTVLAVLSFVAFGAYLLIQIRGPQILEWLKARITYPRTGYAASPYFATKNNVYCDANLNLTPVQDPNAPAIAEIKRVRWARNRRLWFVHAPWICALTGTAIGIILWMGTRADKSVSLLVILGFPVVGFSVGALQLAPHARVGFFILGVGLLFLLDGLVSLVLYLRRNPVASVPVK